MLGVGIHNITGQKKTIQTLFVRCRYTQYNRPEKNNINTFLLGVGIHNITGQKKTIQILNWLGHCIDYNKVCEIEVAQAEVCTGQWPQMNAPYL